LNLLLFGYLDELIVINYSPLHIINIIPNFIASINSVLDE